MIVFAVGPFWTGAQAGGDIGVLRGYRQAVRKKIDMMTRGHFAGAQF
jgi:hypothetical protein